MQNPAVAIPAVIRDPARAIRHDPNNSADEDYANTLWKAAGDLSWQWRGEAPIADRLEIAG